MFPKSARLSREDIAEVSRKGQSINTPYFSLKILPFVSKPLINKGKFAFVMSKKEEKTAVGRNKAKRRLRAAMRHVSPSLKPLHCMVFIKKSVLKAPFGDIVTALEKALHNYV